MKNLVQTLVLRVHSLSAVISRHTLQALIRPCAAWIMVIGFFVATYGCASFSPRPVNLARTVLHTVPHADAVESERFTRTMDRVTHTKEIPGNCVQLFFNGAEIFPAMIVAIDNARKCISIEFYKVRADAVGELFIQALIRAAKRGVRVRFLYDSYGSRSVTYSDFTALVDAGAEVRIFNPVLWFTFLRVNNRDHRKTLVVDGRVAFLGGINLGEEYDGDGLSGWRDTVIMIEGPAAGDAERVFDASWLQGGYGPFGKDLPFVGIYPLKRTMDSPLIRWFHLAGAACVADAPLPVAGQAIVRIVPSDPHYLSSAIVDTYLLAINSARTSIDITNAYFLPPVILRRALVDAAKRGVRLRLILQGSSDAPLTRAVTIGYYGQLLKHGAEIYEWTKSVLHAKTMIVDGVWSTIGSANLDGRALFLSYEVNAAIVDRALAEAVKEQFERDLKYCHQVTWEEWKRRPLTQKVMEIILSPFVGQF
jgi:cardiolipin synthase